MPPIRNSQITRRALFGGAAAASLAACNRAETWRDLFDGRSLAGWRASENPDSWKVTADGLLFADGPRSHLFYEGTGDGANFRNFELELEVKTAPGCNSGVYFHTEYQEKGWPDKGFEIQINNTATGEGGYRENKRTGSLYGIRNVYKPLARDDEWTSIRIHVAGKRIQAWVNGMMTVDFLEPSPPVLAETTERQRVIGTGTFALQCHDPESKAWFRNIRVRPLRDDAVGGGPAPVVDETYRDIITLGARNIPMVDFHTHIKGTLTLEPMLEQSRRDGIFYGIAVNCGKGFTVENDEGARKFFESMKGQPVFTAMQAEGREWTQMFSREAAALFDYIFTDSMTWTDNRGRRMRLWIKDEVGAIADASEFMETLVARAVQILDTEPVDIYVNPTFLPDVLAADYDKLWTEPRMKKVVDALKRNDVALELNDRYQLPGLAFVRMAKEAGVKFTFGTNNAGADDLKRSEYGIRMVKECELRWQDFWMPGLWTPRAIERKGAALRA
ncbi:MAG: DUF1080 domain-containing protein [Bryobacteraceae bacterium]|nr:DUF1080 domain-containing protein [Bryobacteraceae bacterium]